MVPSVDVTAHGDRVADALGIPFAWLDGVVKAESAWDPKARNALSGASGLIQWMKARATELGTSLPEIRGMSAHEQLDLAERDLARWKGKYRRPVDVYLAVFAPSFVGAADDAVLYAKPSRAYEDNAAVDMDHDGAITVADLSAWLARASGGRAVTPRAGIWEQASDGSGVVQLAVMAALAWAGWHYFIKPQRTRKPATRRRRKLAAE